MNLFSSLRILAGLLLVVFLVFFVGLDKVGAAFASFDLVYAIPAFLCVITAVTLSGLSLKTLFAKSKSMDTAHFLQRYFVSNSLGMVSPGRLGDFSIAAMLDESKSKVVGLVTLNKIMSLGIALVFSVGALALLGLNSTQILGIYLLLVLAGALSLFILWKTPSIGFFSHYAQFRTGILEGLKEPAALAASFFLLLLRFIFQALAVYFIFLGFGSAPAFWDVLTIVSSTSILTLVPITYGGLGVREAGFLWLAKAANISASISLAVLIVDLALSLVLVIVSGERGIGFVSKILKHKP